MAAISIAPNAVVRAGIYTRISSDPIGPRAGVERQRTDCEAHCTARGWEITEVFCDNDVSAYGKRPRPAYERMLAAVEASRVDAIVTWHNDRLHRSPKELELQPALSRGSSPAALATLWAPRPRSAGRAESRPCGSRP